MTTIIVLHDDQRLDELEFGPETRSITIGRRPVNDVCIADRSVSGSHARIEIDAERAWVEDLESTNGTYVNGRLARRTPLEEGDELLVGKIRLRFRDLVPTPADAPDERPATDRTTDEHSATGAEAHDTVAVPDAIVEPEASAAPGIVDPSPPDADAPDTAARDEAARDEVVRDEAARDEAAPDAAADAGQDPAGASDDVAGEQAAAGADGDEADEVDRAARADRGGRDLLEGIVDDDDDDLDASMREALALYDDDPPPARAVRSTPVIDDSIVEDDDFSEDARLFARSPTRARAGARQGAPRDADTVGAEGVERHPLDDLRDDEPGGDAKDGAVGQDPDDAGTPATPGLDHQAARSRGAVIEIRNGAKSGQVLPIDKPVTTLGRPGIQIAAIMRKPDGYFLMHIESDDEVERPTLNADAIGDEPVLLHSGDAFTVAGIDVEFMLS